MLLFNPIRLRDKLVEAGIMEHNQAEKFAEAISETDVVELATKADVADIRSDLSGLRAEFSDLRSEFSHLRANFSNLRADYAHTEARLMRWMLAGAALGGLAGGLIAAIAKLF